MVLPRTLKKNVLYKFFVQNMAALSLTIVLSYRMPLFPNKTGHRERPAMTKRNIGDTII